MERDKRLKAMLDAAALASINPLVPAAVRVGVAALVEEAQEQRDRLAALERAIFGKVSNG